MEPSKVSDCRISVFCRFRPMSSSEVECCSRQCYRLLDERTVEVLLAKDAETLRYSFEKVFDGQAGQAQVYQRTTRATLSKFLDGVNGSIIAYGQTSSGKTYTMQGPDGTSPATCGVIPRATADLFQQMESRSNHYRCRLRLSVLEIYLERIRDLLDTSRVDLKIREDPLRGIYVEQLTEIQVSSEVQLQELLAKANKNRMMCATNCNERSSRSHLIVSLMLSQTHLETKQCRLSKLSLVDLAGSEKVSKAGVSGKNLQQTNSINSSLSSLGKVINAIAADKTHVPYRESKLTRLLQESIGGNSVTTFILACSPSNYNLNETISTLRFGDSSQKIRNRPKVNRELTEEELKRELQTARNLNSLLSKKVRQLQDQLNNQGTDVRKIPRLEVGECGRCRSSSFGKFTPPERSTFDRQGTVSGFFSQRVILRHAFIEEESEHHQQSQSPQLEGANNEDELLLDGLDEVVPEIEQKETAEIKITAPLTSANSNEIREQLPFSNQSSIECVFPTPTTLKPVIDQDEDDCRRRLIFSSTANQAKQQPLAVRISDFDLKLTAYQRHCLVITQTLAAMRSSQARHRQACLALFAQQSAQH